MNEQEIITQRQFGATLRALRQRVRISQEELAFRANLDRTYVSSVERGERNISLLNIHALAAGLGVASSELLLVSELAPPQEEGHIPDQYEMRPGFSYTSGITVTTAHVRGALATTSAHLEQLPRSLFAAVDLKTTSAITGAMFAASLAAVCGGIVNPIEKGHPDIVPPAAKEATEAQLRNYPEGLEIKVTVGGVRQGSNIPVGRPRLPDLSGITWQAHHRDVDCLMGLVVDFLGAGDGDFRYPVVSGVFFSCELSENDWGEVSGTTGRNTKVCGMKSEGKRKMGEGWIAFLAEDHLKSKYQRALGIRA